MKVQAGISHLTFTFQMLQLELNRDSKISKHQSKQNQSEEHDIKS